MGDVSFELEHGKYQNDVKFLSYDNSDDDTNGDDEISRDILEAEFGQLKGVSYLDHAGSTLYASSQIDAVTLELKSSLLGNPHSRNASSSLSDDLVEQARIRVARHFNTTLDEYAVIFTSGATAALRLLAESFAWSGVPDGKLEVDRCAPISVGHYIYLEDNHTSVLGIRQVAARHGCEATCLSVPVWLDSLSEPPNNNWQSVEEEEEEEMNPATTRNCLVAYPAQSNFCGRRYPLAPWVRAIRDGRLWRHLPTASETSARWRFSVLLDAAALVGTAPLDLEATRPDFACISFYKMFGFPTGLGALLVRRSTATGARLLQPTYFGGGTVLVAPAADTRFHVPRPALEQSLEAGTISFLDIVALRHGFDVLQRIGLGSARICQRTFRLARRLHRGLTLRRHGNGCAVAVLYCHDHFRHQATQGATVAFNLLREDGTHVGFSQVEKVASVHAIHLRTGCMCNPGACQTYLGLSSDEVMQHFQAGHVCGDERDVIDGRPTGCLRVSFGYMSTAQDVRRLLAMVDACFVEGRSTTTTTTTTDQPKADRREEVEVCNCAVHDSDHCVGAHISAISVFPIKSCAAFRVRNWEVCSRGLRYDREWMIVNGAGVALTQKREPRLCLVRPEVDTLGDRLILRYPGSADVVVPLSGDVIKRETPRSYDKLRRQTKVCGDRVEVIDCGDQVADWLSDVIGIDGCRLVRRLERRGRSVVIEREGGCPASSASLANEAPYLLLNRGSAAALALKIRASLKTGSSVARGNVPNDEDVDKLLARFRGNLVVGGAPPFDEESWRRLRIGRIDFQVRGPCSRCQMVCINQDSGEKTREPLVTLASTRGRNGIHFGVYLSCSNLHNDANDIPIVSSMIRVGDPVQIF